MNEHGWDLDRIVAEVVRRLQTRLANSGETSAAKEARTEPQAAEKHDLSVEERVVTLTAIHGRLNGVRRLLVRRDAVVTPSVRDELRKRSIAIERGNGPPATDVQQPSLVVAVAETDYDAAALLVQVRGTLVQTRGLKATVAELAKRVRENQQLAVLVTDRAAPALCLANRHDGVRAALGGNAAMARDAVQSVGANLLVIDPEERNLAELAGTIREYQRGGPRECPAEFRGVL
jgi:hypothetical protein